MHDRNLLYFLSRIPKPILLPVLKYTFQTYWKIIGWILSHGEA